MRKAAIILIVCSLAVGCGVSRKDRPEAPVWNMFKAAGSADVKGYLNCFSEQIVDKIKATIEEMGYDQFRRYLRNMDESIMGIAITDRENIAEDKIRLKVELVFRDRNEVQKIVVGKERGAWKIVEMSDSARIKTLIPYGTNLYPIRSDEEK